MTKGFFITATDTDVGKTVITAGLAGAFSHQGIDVGVMKPVQAGASDAAILIKAANCDDPFSLVTPYNFKEPLSPNVAAEREGVVISLEKIIECYQKLSARHEMMLLEGAGGVCVPLSDTCLMIDLIKECNLPVIVVTRPGLGTINHTVLTINQLDWIGVKVAGIIINYTKYSSGVAEETNPKIIERITRKKILGIVPFRQALTTPSGIEKEAQEAMMSAINIEYLVKE